MFGAAKHPLNARRLACAELTFLRCAQDDNWLLAELANYS